MMALDLNLCVPTARESFQITDDGIKLNTYGLIITNTILNAADNTDMSRQIRAEDRSKIGVICKQEIELE